eukprot:scaffold17707_cov212-Amphora_coffeaeformis.AAC.3
MRCGGGSKQCLVQRHFHMVQLHTPCFHISIIIISGLCHLVAAVQREASSFEEIVEFVCCCCWGNRRPLCCCSKEQLRVPLAIPTYSCDGPKGVIAIVQESKDRSLGGGRCCCDER